MQMRIDYTFKEYLKKIKNNLRNSFDTIIGFSGKPSLIYEQN